MNQSENDIRNVAQSIYLNVGQMNQRGGPSQQQQYDMYRQHSINLMTDDFLGGYMQDGRMSVVRRFFCLFVTFDLIFVALLWLISILITGDNIYHALKVQVLQYSVYQSMFDVVMAAICRFVILILFYAIVNMNHWFIVALTTSGSCLFLICKVFVYDWVHSPNQVFQVVLIVTSFVLAWGEAWFLDGRVIPQERHARSYFNAITSPMPTSDRSPLLAPFLSSIGEPRTAESVANFYSPYDSIHNSDDEDGQDDEYAKMGIECVRKAYELLQADDWKVEKITSKNDTIQSIHREKLGKIYRLTGRIRYPPKKLLNELFFKIEDVPRWNTTLLESKIIRKINNQTDISYQATIGGGGGIIKSRDFVNLRCWRKISDGKIIEEDEDNDDDDDSLLNRSCEGSVSTISENEDGASEIQKSNSEVFFSGSGINNAESKVFQTLSKSLGAKDFQHFASEPPSYKETDSVKTSSSASSSVPKEKTAKPTNKIYVSAAIGIEYPSVPVNPKYTRGENLVSCWAMREIDGKPDSCIFEWILCLDLKGYIPKYILDTAYTTLMQDYMVFLRKYCSELRQERKHLSQCKE